MMTRSPARRSPARAALVALAVLAAAACAAPAFAQGRQPAQQRPQGEVLRIAAVVNEDVVSVLELQARVRLTLITAGLPPTQETVQRLQPQILRNLIDERLQLQEALRLGIQVPDQEVESAMRRIEQANRMPANALPDMLRRAGVPPSALQSQIRSTIAWQRAVQMRRGVPFPALALQFSQSTSAANGGDIGWVEQGTLDDAAETAIRQVNPPGISQPIRSVGGYYLYGVRARRTIAQASPDDVIVEVSQLRLPVERGPRADQAALLDLAEQVRSTVSGCDDLRRVASELQVPPPADPQRGRLGQLPPQFRQIITGLRVGEASRPITLPQGLIILIVCARDHNPDRRHRAQLTETLLRTRLDAQARRLLRDLRRAAFIDIRV